MSPESVMSLAHEGMTVAVLLAAPLLLTALVIGLLISLFQAVTQINEMTLSFIPKVLGIFAALIFTGPFLIQLITEYTTELFQGIPLLIQ